MAPWPSTPRPRRWRVALGLSLAAVVATAALAALGWWWAGTTRTEMAQWFMAGASMLTLVAAVVAGVYAAGAFRLESDREEQWSVAQRRAQARLIAAWPDSVHPYHESNIHDSASSEPALVFVAFRNASDLPVVQVKADVYVNVRPKYAGRYEVTTYSLGGASMPVLPPDLEPKLVGVRTDRPEGMPQRLGLAGEVEYDVTIELTFTDSAGVRWSRSTEGLLIDLGDAWRGVA